MNENKFVHKIPGYGSLDRCSHCGFIARVIVTLGNDIDRPRDRHFFTLCGSCARSMADGLIEQLGLKVCDISSPDNKEIGIKRPWLTDKRLKLIDTLNILKDDDYDIDEEGSPALDGPV